MKKIRIILEDKVKKIIITTGGTGGHIYPALAVAEEFKRRGIEVVFVGSKTRMEKTIVPNAGYKFIGLNVLPSRKVINILKFILEIVKAIKIVIQERPDAILGFGNYISVPILTAGFLLRKTLYLQEQNSNIGVTNKIFYRVSKKLFLAFEETLKELPTKDSEKFIVTGNPLRKEIENIDRNEIRQKLKIKDKEKILLITGGSLGAQDINQAIIEYWSKLEAVENLKIYWATGSKNYEEISSKLNKLETKNVVEPYFENMIEIMAIADLVLSRAGALTISEIIQLEKPSILIPYDSIKVGQYGNAKILEEISGAYVYNNKEVKIAIEKIIEIINCKETLNSLSEQVKSLKKGNAASEIVDYITEIKI